MGVTLLAITIGVLLLLVIIVIAVFQRSGKRW
jgi:hypothetical protein